MSTAIASDVENLSDKLPEQETTPYKEHLGIVSALRELLRPIPPFRQADILYNLKVLAHAPGFSKASLTTAIDFLMEGNKITGQVISEYGVKRKGEVTAQVNWVEIE